MQIIVAQVDASNFALPAPPNQDAARATISFCWVPRATAAGVAKGVAESEAERRLAGFMGVADAMQALGLI